MIAPALPPGWGYEAEDASVGIFGDFIWHDDCPGIPTTEVGEPREAVETETSRLSADGKVRYWDLHLACPYEDCGAEITVKGWRSESAAWGDV
jgi:hypothetical protein